MTDPPPVTYRVPLIHVRGMVAFEMPAAFLSTVTPHGPTRWLSFRSIDQPGLVLVPFVTQAQALSLVTSLFADLDEEAREAAVAVALADADDITNDEFSPVVALGAHHARHAGLQREALLVQLDTYGLLIAAP